MTFYGTKYNKASLENWFSLEKTLNNYVVINKTFKYTKTQIKINRKRVVE